MSLAVEVVVIPLTTINGLLKPTVLEVFKGCKGQCEYTSTYRCNIVRRVDYLDVLS